MSNRRIAIAIAIAATLLAARAGAAPDLVKLGNLKFAHYGAVSFMKDHCARFGLQVEEIVFPYVRTPYFRWWQPLGFVRLTTMLGLERVIPGLRFELKSPPFWGNMMTCYAMKPK